MDNIVLNYLQEVKRVMQYPSKAFRSCQGIQALEKKYGRDCLVCACADQTVTTRISGHTRGTWTKRRREFLFRWNRENTALHDFPGSANSQKHTWVNITRKTNKNNKTLFYGNKQLDSSHYETTESEYHITGFNESHKIIQYGRGFHGKFCRHHSLWPQTLFCPCHLHANETIMSRLQ